MAKEPRNLGASIRARLLQVAKQKNQTFDLVLTRYALERLLFRLATSAHADRFILKGAMLLMTWFDEPFRATRDLDLLGYGDPSPEAVLEVFRDLFGMEKNDGVQFDAAAARVDRIREDNDYGGLRIRTRAEIDGARIAIAVDIGFGDATDPGAEMLDYPVLLDMPAPRLRGYARETVVAEKFQAIVALGRANSRMKDYYDLWALSQSFDFDQPRLAGAILATFSRRMTPIPEVLPDGLTEAFAIDPQKQQQWQAFIRDVNLDPGPLDAVVSVLADFLMPAAGLARSQVVPR